MCLSKKWFWILPCLLALVFSCTEDDPFRVDDIIVSPPDLKLVEKDEYVNRIDTIDFTCPFVAQLEARMGDFVIASIAIKEDTVLVDPSRIMIFPEQVDNPYIITGDDKDGFLYDISILPSPEAKEEVQYTFEVTDTLGNKEVLNLNLKTVGSLNPELSTEDFTSVAVETGSIFAVSVEGKANCSPLAKLYFYEEGSLSSLFYQDSVAVYDSLTMMDTLAIMDVSRITNNGNIIPSNPIELGESSSKYFNDLFIINGNTRADSFKVEVVLEAINGGRDTVTYFVRTGSFVEDISGGGEIYNRNEKDGRGVGLDLDTGVNVQNDSLSQLEAEIADIGNGTGVDSLFWLRQIRGMNGTTVRTMLQGERGLAEDFDFIDVDLKEDLKTFFNKGVPFTQSKTFITSVDTMIMGMDTTYVFNDTTYMVSDRIKQGDVFSASRVDSNFVNNIFEGLVTTYYMFRINQITPDNSSGLSDRIRVDIIK